MYQSPNSWGADNVNTPDNDGWRSGKHITGNSGSITISTNEFIIANADRNNTHFLVDYSSNVSRGFIWVVEINGNSYYSDDTAGIQQYGSMSSNQFIDTWQENIGIDIESVLWNGGLSLPPGDITSFGIKINNQDNADSYAIDNFRVYYGIDPISYYFNPVANVSGTTGGVFTASSNDISIDTSTGEIDLDNSLEVIPLLTLLKVFVQKQQPPV